jgi:hypothetical protein
MRSVRLLLVFVSFSLLSQVHAASISYFRAATDTEDSMLLLTADGKIHQRRVGSKTFRLFRAQLPGAIKPVEILVRPVVVATDRGPRFQNHLFVIGSDGEVYLLKEEDKEFQKQAYEFPDLKIEPKK